MFRSKYFFPKGKKVIFFYNFSAFHHDLYVEIVIEYSTFYHDFVLSVTISLCSVTISRNSITIYQPQNFPEGFCFGNPRSKSKMSPQNGKSYLENRKSYEFLYAIFEFRLKDLFWKSWIKIEDVSQKSKKLSREP